MATWTGTVKNSSTFSSASSKNASTYVTPSKSSGTSATATAGLYYGFGALTYSGGQVLTPSIWSTTNKS